MLARIETPVGTRSHPVRGRGGDDRIHCLAGDDWVMGAERNDVIDGGEGTDTAWGGGGRNTCVDTEEGDCDGFPWPERSRPALGDQSRQQLLDEWWSGR